MFNRAGLQTIRAKLLALFALQLVAFVIASVIYFAVLAPVGRIQAEQQTLTDLRSAFFAEEVAANRLATAPIDTQLDVFQAAVKNTSKASLRVKQLRLLPSLAPSIQKSLAAIQQLNELVGQTLVPFDQNISAVKKSTEQILLASGTAVGTQSSIFDLYGKGVELQTHGVDLGYSTVAHIGDWVGQLSLVSGVLDKAVAVIDAQYATIETAIRRIELRSNIVAAAVAVLFVVAMFILGVFFAGRIVRSVKSLEGNIASMKSGDLTQVSSVATRDEIGKLSANLNQFMISLREAINNVQGVSSENVRLKENLIVTTEQASASANEITANTESINNQISTLDENLLGSATAVQNIAESIGSLNGQIQEQLTMVEESTASVTEMIASIDNVTKIADNRRSATDRLVSTVSSGGEKMAATMEVVKLINESMDSIKDITGIIEGVSSQTNLLAMNAAIEAAHAGDAGRGFSVVADEIRKLAEASAENSQEISRILAVIVERIGEASASGAQLNAAFEEIDREVKELSASLTEIFASMSELHSGGDQILKAMTVLQEVSANVKSSSGTINSSSTDIQETMTTVQRVSAEVRSGMGEISGGIKEISTAVSNVLVIAERLGNSSESLNRELSQFRTK